MFGHLKAHEFMNVIEGSGISPSRLAHLNSCTACRTRLRSIESVHGSLAADDNDIPEPDWNEFRSSVRTELLSRSVQRESAIRRWTGWPIRPAMAWSLSLVLMVSLTIGGFLWQSSQRGSDALLRQAPGDASNVTTPAKALAEELIDMNTVDVAMAAWSDMKANVFEEMAQLKADEAAQLLVLLENAQKGTMEKR